MADHLATEYIYTCCARRVFGPRLGESCLFLTGPCPECQEEALIQQEQNRVRVESRRARLVRNFWQLFGRRPEASLNALQRVEAAIGQGGFSRRIWGGGGAAQPPRPPQSPPDDPVRELRDRVHAASERIAASADIPEVGAREIADAAQAREQLRIPFHPLGAPAERSGYGRRASSASHRGDVRWEPYTVPELRRESRFDRIETPMPSSNSLANSPRSAGMGRRGAISHIIPIPFPESNVRAERGNYEES